jgi:hypothetical protein
MYYGEDFMNPFLEKVIISKCRYDLTRYDVTLPSDKCLDIYKDIENLINPSPDLKKIYLGIINCVNFTNY